MVKKLPTSIAPYTYITNSKKETVEEFLKRGGIIKRDIKNEMPKSPFNGDRRKKK